MRRVSARSSPAPCSPPSIGIGGRLATPPLPHHRAYGSVPRRFGGLSARQRIHRKQSKTLEASVGEGAVQRARRTQPPRSLLYRGIRQAQSYLLLFAFLPRLGGVGR